MKNISKMVDLEELKTFLKNEEARLKNLSNDYYKEENYYASTRCAAGAKRLSMVYDWAEKHTYSVELTENEAIMPWLLYKVESCEAAEKEWQKKYLEYISDVDKSFSMGLHCGREDMALTMKELLTGVAEYEY